MNSVARNVARIALALILTISMAPHASVHAWPVSHDETLTRASIFEHGASAAIAVDLTTGIELYSFNADEPLAPASTMKLVTALVAIRELNPDDLITIEPHDLLDPEEYSVVGLLDGDIVSVRDLLHGLLLPSGGDAAMALARTVGHKLDASTTDPVDRFVVELNSYANSIGLDSSHFANPTGADDPGLQQSSARDLVRATELALNDWLLASIVRADFAVIEVHGPNAREIAMTSTNLLIGRDDVFGVKTGTEDVARQCLIAGFWRGDNQIVTVILGSEDRYADTLALMEEVDSRYRWMALGVGTVSGGATAALSDMGLTFLIRRTVIMEAWMPEQLRWELIENSSDRGNHHGVVRFAVEGREVARLPVY